MTIGTRMAAEREKAGLKRSEVARRCGINPEVLFKYETDRMVPGGDKVARIATAIGCTTDSILLDEPCPEEPSAVAVGE